MKAVDKIAERIESLSGVLKQGGKIGPAEFYSCLGKKIRNAVNILELKRILLDDVKKSGAIVQYANFSAEEERISNEIYDLSEKILEQR